MRPFVAQVLVVRDTILDIVREIHLASGIDVVGMVPGFVYLPEQLSFGTFCGQRLNEVPSPREYHTNNLGTFLGVAPRWLTDYFGWMPVIGAKVEVQWHDVHHVQFTYSYALEPFAPPAALACYQPILAAVTRWGQLVGVTDPREEGDPPLTLPL